jgi:heavy metal sensor kinase
MSLTTRLSAFFLSALALVLVGFALTLYLLARIYLYRQLDERLSASLNTLAAVVENEDGGLEWEPAAHHLSLGQDAGRDQVRWFIRDGNGLFVDRSPNLASEDLRASDWPALGAEERSSQTVDQGGDSWRIQQQRIEHTPLQVSAVGHPPDNEPPKPKYAALVISAAVSRQPVNSTLHSLALALIGLSAGLWAAAALMGRWLCRRALAPMRSMATTARAMSAASREQRLPNPGTGDELEELGRAFNDLLARLHEAFERQERFTGDASHQLRTPLTAMLGQIDVILRRDRTSEEYRDVLGRIRDQTGRLHQLVEMLLFLARADKEARLPDLETVDLAPWLESYLERWADHPRAGDLRLEQSAAGPFTVLIQPPLFGQLLDNLLENACKYSPARTAITLRLGRDSGQITCVVEDLGEGIAADDLAHVFEPFYRSEHARRYGGAGVGLGLAVVQRIAAAFGGTVTAQSEPGRGSRFTIRLPEVEKLSEVVGALPASVA